ncbi:CopG family ribbon-helix-helix protein [Haloterrigena sp. SYSU A558-1]|uniref:CopG family ribbon-helix-helix protein n=1 Tax=Haloterrigena gelatinilytica TaxID=2741724 RepID=A0A8J8GR90_9EURY|nr:CopG family ribbon-helix-helix protein [Haloterrigena gelatinilytica]NUB93009.1 CopG family ribbon-helix-helix protein [Haloterrigena gelatinilytica]NUC71081.1 CopG family ribbon-helix-helix protein [Haloterrigena gelatinilytica]
MRTSFNIPDDLLAEFDQTWQTEEFDSRSRAVREAMQEYIEAHTELETVSGEVTAALAFDYQHERVIRELHGVQHDFQDVITTTSHTHEGDWCLETIFCRGEAARVRKLVYRLRDFDAVGQVKVLLLRS